ncbi:hypothetical protein [Cohnella nanjingensis]|uniref:Uncharacterized protein n=1 Tax=Cohnella nanjingensis TaxID=1387779 RepID=A0A7X0RZS2_9BACL|nr:hypothetical protein [Cohnella nanjingensis]MBB6675511.1 hypothetical protein [Cohnella nanjingensis]
MPLDTYTRGWSGAMNSTSPGGVPGRKRSAPRTAGGIRARRVMRHGA